MIKKFIYDNISSGMSIKLDPQSKKTLTNLGVIAVYLFGSRAQGRAGPFSDFDFAVLLKDPQRVRKYSGEDYNAIYPVLASVTHPKSLAEDVIDIIFLDSPRVPLEIKSYIVRKGRILLDVDPRRRVHFEEHIMRETADFAPLRNLMRQALLARL